MTSAAFSKDGQWLVYEDGDAVRLSHVTDDRMDKDYKDCYWWQSNGYFEEGVSSVAVSADWQWLAHDDENTVKLWHVSGDRSLAHTYTCHDSEDESLVVFSSDSQWLASGSSNGVVQLWNVAGNRSLAHTYIGHGNEITSIAFASNGKWLASGGYDGTVRLWSVLTDDCHAVLQSFTGPIQAVTWQPMQDDGSAILCTKGEGSTLCFWQVFSNAGQISTIVLDRISGQDTTTLTATGALIENARNLSPQNAALLRQRDAKQTQISELHS